jgi:hypothetical protein
MAKNRSSIGERLMKRTTLTLFAALACTIAAPSIQQARAQKADAKAPLDQFDAFVGDWNCTGKMPAFGETPAHATTARAHGEKAVGDQWILVRFDEEKTAASPNPFHIDQYFGYDSTKKQFVTVAAHSGGYFSGSSKGWSGDSITFDETGADKSTSRDTFGRNGQDEISHYSSEKNKEGKWIKGDEETCQRIK